jgi:hypothetical protein
VGGDGAEGAIIISEPKKNLFIIVNAFSMGFYKIINFPKKNQVIISFGC